jgi:hypothetical protein
VLDSATEWTYTSYLRNYVTILTTDIVVLPVKADSVRRARTLQLITPIQTSAFFFHKKITHFPISFANEQRKRKLFRKNLILQGIFTLSLDNVDCVFSNTAVRTSNSSKSFKLDW